MPRCKPLFVIKQRKQEEWKCLEPHSNHPCHYKFHKCNNLRLLKEKNKQNLSGYHRTHPRQETEQKNGFRIYQCQNLWTSEKHTKNETIHVFGRIKAQNSKSTNGKVNISSVLLDQMWPLSSSTTTKLLDLHNLRQYCLVHFIFIQNMKQTNKYLDFHDGTIESTQCNWLLQKSILFLWLLAYSKSHFIVHLQQLGYATQNNKPRSNI